jgi:hypothetical protein
LGSLLATLLPLQAVHWAIDELKAVVPIWKKVRGTRSITGGGARGLGW